MAKVKLNPVMERIRGRIGGLVFKRSFGTTSVSALTDSTHEPSPAQQQIQEQFKLAATYGRSVLADPARRPFYEAIARARNVPLFSVMMGDYLKPPVVAEVDVSRYRGQPGDPVRILATDDVDVVSVHVVIRDAADAVVEQGAAILDRESWLYTATTAPAAGEPLTITVVATDRPGNEGTKAVAVTVPEP